MKRSSAWLLPLLLASACGGGGDAHASAAPADTPENRDVEAWRYLEVMPPRTMLEDMTAGLRTSLPEDEAAELSDELLEHLDVPELERRLHESLVDHFTAPELAALADFYGSEVGRSAMSKFGPYMEDVLPLLQSEVTRAMQRSRAGGEDTGPESERGK